jgi:hypothetical protein
MKGGRNGFDAMALFESMETRRNRDSDGSVRDRHEARDENRAMARVPRGHVHLRREVVAVLTREACRRWSF